MSFDDLIAWLIVAILSLVVVAASASAGNDITAMIASRGARALILSRGTMPPPKPTPPGPKPTEPCCNECRGTGRWKPDTVVETECPCDPSCKCKSKGAAPCKTGNCKPGATK